MSGGRKETHYHDVHDQDEFMEEIDKMNYNKNEWFGESYEKKRVNRSVQKSDERTANIQSSVDRRYEKDQYGRRRSVVDTNQRPQRGINEDERDSTYDDIWGDGASTVNHQNEPNNAPADIFGYKPNELDTNDFAESQELGGRRRSALSLDDDDKSRRGAMEDMEEEHKFMNQLSGYGNMNVSSPHTDVNQHILRQQPPNPARFQHQRHMGNPPLYQTPMTTSRGPIPNLNPPNFHNPYYHSSQMKMQNGPRYPPYVPHYNSSQPQIQNGPSYIPPQTPPHYNSSQPQIQNGPSYIPPQTHPHYNPHNLSQPRLQNGPSYVPPHNLSQPRLQNGPSYVPPHYNPHNLSQPRLQNGSGNPLSSQHLPPYMVNSIPKQQLPSDYPQPTYLPQYGRQYPTL
jgi:hypothetical protein